MALIVESGAGDANAESYNSVADFKTYAANHGLSTTGFTTSQIETASRRATTYIDAFQFQGFPTQRRNQALQHPRGDMYDKNGDYIDSTSVAREVIKAHHEATFREMTTPGSLNPDLVRGGMVIMQRDRVEGAVETETQWAAGAPARDTFTVISAILSGLLVDGSRIVRS